MDFFKSTIKPYIPNLKFEYPEYPQVLGDEIDGELDTLNIESFCNLPSLLTPCGFGMLNSNNDSFNITESDDPSNYYADAEYISDYESDLYTDDDYYYYIDNVNVNIDDEEEKVYYDNFSEDSDTCTEIHPNNNTNSHISNNHINNHINNYTNNNHINNCYTNNGINNHHTTNYYTTINDYITKDYTNSNNYTNDHATNNHANNRTNNYTNNHAISNHAMNNYTTATNDHTTNTHDCANNHANNHTITTNNYNTNNSKNITIKTENPLSFIGGDYIESSQTQNFTSDGENKNEKFIKQHDCDEPKLYSSMGDLRGLATSFTKMDSHDHDTVKIKTEPFNNIEEFYASINQSNNDYDYLNNTNDNHQNDFVKIKTESFNNLEDFLQNYEIETKNIIDHHYYDDDHEALIKLEPCEHYDEMIEANNGIRIEQSDHSGEQFIGLNIQPCLGSSIILPGSSKELPAALFKNVDLSNLSSEIKQSYDNIDIKLENYIKNELEYSSDSDLSDNYNSFIENEKLSENLEANVNIKLEDEKILYSYSVSDSSSSEFSSEEIDLESFSSGEESILSYDDQNNDTYAKYTEFENSSDLSDDDDNYSNFEYYDNKVLKPTTLRKNFEPTISRKKRKYDDSNNNDEFYYDKQYNNRTLHKKRRIEDH